MYNIIIYASVLNKDVLSGIYFFHQHVVFLHIAEHYTTS